MAQNKKIYIIYYDSRDRVSEREEWSPGIEAADKMLYYDLAKHPYLSYVGAVNIAENVRNREMNFYPNLRLLNPLRMEDKYVYINRNYRFTQDLTQSNIGTKCWPTVVLLTDDGVDPGTMDNCLTLDRDNETEVRTKLGEFLKHAEDMSGYTQEKQQQAQTQASGEATQKTGFKLPWSK